MIYYDNTSERDQTRITSSSIVDGSLGWFVRVLQVLTPWTSVDLWSVHQAVAVLFCLNCPHLGTFLGWDFCKFCSNKNQLLALTVPRSLIRVLLNDQTLPDNTFFLKLEHSLDHRFKLIPACGLLLLHEVGRRAIRGPSVLLPPELFLVRSEIFGVLIFLIFGELWDT